MAQPLVGESDLFYMLTLFFAWLDSYVLYVYAVKAQKSCSIELRCILALTFFLSGFDGHYPQKRLSRITTKNLCNFLPCLFVKNHVQLSQISIFQVSFQLCLEKYQTERIQQ